jgi:hypothetical protein
MLCPHCIRDAILCALRQRSWRQVGECARLSSYRGKCVIDERERVASFVAKKGDKAASILPGVSQLRRDNFGMREANASVLGDDIVTVTEKPLKPPHFLDGSARDPDDTPLCLHAREFARGHRRAVRVVEKRPVEVAEDDAPVL